MTLLTRLRALARSIYLPHSQQDGPPTSLTDEHKRTEDPSTGQSQSSPNAVVGGKIHPDINALLASVESEDVVEDVSSSRFWMSSTDHSDDEKMPRTLKPRTRPVENNIVVEGEEEEAELDREEHPGPYRKREKEKGRADEGHFEYSTPDSSKTPSGSQRGWSTFGRDRMRHLPDLRVFGMTPKTPPTRRARTASNDRMEEGSAAGTRQSLDNANSSRIDVTKTTHSSIPSRHGSSLSVISAVALSKRSSSKAPSSQSPPLQPSGNTVSSRTISRTPSQTRRITDSYQEATPSMSTTSHGGQDATTSISQVEPQSPAALTFGESSPAPSYPWTSPVRPSAAPSSPPAFFPLHSTPNKARTRTPSVVLSPATTTDDDHLTWYTPQTSPDKNFRLSGSNRSRLTLLGGTSSATNSVAFPPSSSTFGRPHNSRARAVTDRPKASKIFPMHAEADVAATSRAAPLSNATNLRPRTRTETPQRRGRYRSSRRRKSAEWRSQTAAAGVTANDSEVSKYGWPTDVSREILMLSLGDPALSPTARVSSSSTSVGRSSVVQGGQRAVIQPTSNKNALEEQIYVFPNMETVSHRDKLSSASRHDGQMRSEGQVHAPSFSFPIPPPSSSLPTAPLAAAAGYASAIVDPKLSLSEPQPGSGPSLQSQGDGIKISEAEGQVKGGTEVDSTGEQGVDKELGSEDGMIQHVHSNSETQIRWNSKKMQEYLDRAERESGEGGVKHDTSIALPPKETVRLVASTSSKARLSATSMQSPFADGAERSRTESFGDQAAATSTPTKSDKIKGKRKAEETEDGSPPVSTKVDGKKTTFATPMRGPRVSGSSHAPSSYLSQKSRKRVRLSSPLPSPSHSRRESESNGSNAKGIGSWSSRNSSKVTHASNSMAQSGTPSPPRPTSRVSYAPSGSVMSGGGRAQTRRPLSRMSQSSIPISAIISPHPPSIDRLSTFHVRDPHRPPQRRPVDWTLRLQSVDEHGSPRQAWCFWLGFLLPLLWWIASVLPIPKTRMLDAEKAITIEDPNVEHEARTWRTRCRVASVVFFFTYVPVIVLLAVFAPRS